MVEIKSNKYFNSCPQSAVPSHVGLFGIIGLAFGVIFVFIIQPSSSWEQVILILMAGTPMWFLEWRRAPESSKRNLNIPLSDRVLWRLYGLIPFLFFLICIIFFMIYFSPDIIAKVFLFFEEVWVLVLFFIPAYLISPIYNNVGGLDGLGRSLALRQRVENYWELFRAGLLKIFFLLLMFSFSASWIDAFGRSSEELSSGLAGIFILCLTVLYMIDTVFGLIGYLSTSKRLNSHIRESNPYWWSWLVTLICYPPFFSWLMATGLPQYRDGLSWSDWLGYGSIFSWLWGGAIIWLTLIYAWSTVVFGIRFSNLTNRGVITNGPYRYTKHPAYIAKNISWWLISVPFISSFNFFSAFFACSALVFVNLIYLFRARAEEKHLMSDPVYREYAQWIKYNGLFSYFFRYLSFLFPRFSIRVLTFCVVLLSMSSALWLWTTDEGKTYRFMSINQLHGAILVTNDYASNIVETSAYGSLVGLEGDIYPMASLSKLITAAAINRLILSGELSFDSIAISYLKDFNPIDSRFSDVTIINLLQHRAGFDRNVSEDPLFDAKNTIGCKEALKIVELNKLDFDPGTETQYSNIGYCILGEVIEAKLGMLYEEAIFEILFNGEKPSWLYMGGPLNYVNYSHADRVHEWHLLGAAGGWFANPEMFARFLGDEFNQQFLDKLFSSQKRLDDAFYYGLGWRVWRSGCWTHFGDLPGIFLISTLKDKRVNLALFDQKNKRLEPVAEDLLFLCGK